MLFKYNGAVWSRVDAVQWNQNIRDYVTNNTNRNSVPVAESASASYDATRENYEASVLRTILNVTSTFKILYLIGSTWVHFGPYDLVREESRDILQNFGKLTWESGPKKGYDSWKDVHESQVRLVHRMKGWNLIGLENSADYKASFDSFQKTGLIDEMSDPTLLAWLVRLCHRHPKHPLRKEC
jgi:hypothetical protein